MMTRSPSLATLWQSLLLAAAPCAFAACPSSASTPTVSTPSAETASARIAEKKQVIVATLQNAHKTGRALTGTQVNEREIYADCDSSDRLTQMIGHEPAILGLELGYPGHFQGYDDLIVEHAIEHSRRGGIVTLTWHAPNPLKDCALGQDYKCSLDRMNDEEFNRMVTPGTREYARWLEDIAGLALVLKRLEQAEVVVLFRPLHEMNGGWFWWGKRQGFPQLWDTLFDRLKGGYNLTNLIRVWAANGEASDGDIYFPTSYLPEVVGTDLYRTNQGGPKYENGYRNVAKLSPGTLFSFAEVGHVPPASIMQEAKPAWVLVWGREFLNKEWGWDPAQNKRLNTIDETIEFFTGKNIAKLEDIPMASREIIAGGKVIVPERPVCPATWPR